MKKVILEEQDQDTVNLSDVCTGTPIFAKNSKGELAGMVVKESGGWILKIGGSMGATGNYGDRRQCLESCIRHGYTFVVAGG